MKAGLSEIVVLLDRSGSMGSIKSDVVGGFNEFLRAQQAAPGEAAFTLVQFDSDGPHDILQERVPLLAATPINGDTYQPRGCTPLYDAVGWTIDHVGDALSKLPVDQQPEKVIFAIMTDGLENASQEYDKKAVFSKVQHQQDRWGWVFVYLGANQDAMAEATKIGINYNSHIRNVFAYAATGTGIRSAYCSMHCSTVAYRATPVVADMVPVPITAVTE